MAETRVVFPALNEVVLEAFEVPATPLADHEVLVRTHCTVISPGTELARLQGRLMFDSDDLPPFPLEPGYANVGTVQAAGSGTGVRPGDRVYTMGTHASLVRLDVRERLCVPVPDGLSDDVAAFARFATVSMTTLVTTRARPGALVAVVGLGLVGNLAAQVFQACGYRVVGFDLDPQRREIARRAGIAEVETAIDSGAWSQRASLVIEATGSARALASSVDSVRQGGEIVMVGAPWGGAANSVPSSEITRLLFYRFLTLRSGSEWEVPRQPVPLVWGSHQEHAATALGWLADGRLRVEPLITDRIRPDGVAEAYAGLRDAPNAHLGVVIDWR